MLESRVKVDGDLLSGFADDVVGELRERAETAVRKAAKVVGDAMRRNLSRTRRRPAEKGQAPRKRKGKLLSSVTESEPTWKGNTCSASAGVHPGAPADEYAARLEFGGQEEKAHGYKRDAQGRFSGSGNEGMQRRRIHPHPWARPAMDASRDKVARILEEL